MSPPLVSAPDPPRVTGYERATHNLCRMPSECDLACVATLIHYRNESDSRRTQAAGKGMYDIAADGTPPAPFQRPLPLRLCDSHHLGWVARLLCLSVSATRFRSFSIIMRIAVIASRAHGMRNLQTAYGDAHGHSIVPLLDLETLMVTPDLGSTRVFRIDLHGHPFDEKYPRLCIT